MNLSVGGWSSIRIIEPTFLTELSATVLTNLITSICYVVDIETHFAKSSVVHKHRENNIWKGLLLIIPTGRGRAETRIHFKGYSLLCFYI